MTRVTPPQRMRALAMSMSGLVLLAILCSVVWTQEKKKIATRVRELQQQRLTVLEAIREDVNKLYKSIRPWYGEISSAERDLLTARIELAETSSERLKAMEVALENTRKWKELAQFYYEGGRGTQFEVLTAEALLLEIQLMQEAEKARP